MIYRNMELHNVDELVEQDDGSMLLQRVPEDVRRHLNDFAQARMRDSDGCEIRFVADGPACEVTLSTIADEFDDEAQVEVFFGEYQGMQYRINAEPRTIRIEKPDRLFRADGSCIKQDTFSRDVCRVRLANGQVCLHGVKGDNVRPPGAEEVPVKRLLMYGTSITQGAAASNPHLSYAAITARLLGMDLINLGSGGSCFCEREKADYIAARGDWDMAVLALSVNMRGHEIGEFYKRVSYMVDTVAATGKPVVCITLWPYFNDLTENGEPMDPEPGAATTPEFRQKLRDAVKNCPHANVTLLEGPELFTDTGGLTGDLIHPGDYGMIEMGRNLAAALRGIV